MEESKVGYAQNQPESSNKVEEEDEAASERQALQQYIDNELLEIE